MPPTTSLKTRLQHANAFWFSVYATGAAFCAYTCLFAFRKPFTVATFEGLAFAGIGYKIWLITAQVLGYMLSKFIGIKVIAEMSGERRAAGLLGIALAAVLSLLGFALTPPPYNAVFMFLNGLPLGMGWGLMFGYLEGRRVTEVLGAGLSVSFIFSSGFSKSIGKWVMQSWGVSEFWMPLAVAGLFLPPLVGFVYLLGQLPPPSPADVALRTVRKPMNARERLQFVQRFLGGLVLLILAYMLLTVYREFRDNYAAELWLALGYGGSSEIFTLTETPVALGVMLAVSLMMLVKDNRTALMLNHAMVFGGFVLVGGSTWAYEAGLCGPLWWMVLVGMGLYLGYVPFNSVFFDRLIATFRYASNVGFLIYLADSFGYLGSVAVLFYKNFGQAQMPWLQFFISASYWVAFGGGLLTLGAWAYFWNKSRETLPPST